MVKTKPLATPDPHSGRGLEELFETLVKNKVPFMIGKEEDQALSMFHVQMLHCLRSMLLQLQERGVVTLLQAKKKDTHNECYLGFARMYVKDPKEFIAAAKNMIASHPIGLYHFDEFDVYLMLRCLQLLPSVKAVPLKQNSHYLAVDCHGVSRVITQTVEMEHPLNYHMWNFTQRKGFLKLWKNYRQKRMASSNDNA